MVAPHLPMKPGGQALGLARDDEGWEAMAMRDELTDVMLHSAFADAILKEVCTVLEPPVSCPQSHSGGGRGSQLPSPGSCVT